MEKVSLIICNYNNGHFFKRCYESICEQTYQNIEIIIIDDCSTDNSLSIINELIHDNAKYKLYTNDINKGYATTLKKGINLATGDFIARVDPDDAIYKHSVEKSIKGFKDLNIVATYSKILLCDDQLNPEKVYPNSKQIRNSDSHFFNINNEVSHFFTFRKEIYLQTEGINPKVNGAEDFDLYLKLYEKGNFKFINEPLYYYRQHQGGVSQNSEKKERAHKIWNTVLYNTCVRRGITEIDGFKVLPETNLTEIIFKKENTLMKRISRKINKYLSL